MAGSVGEVVEKLGTYAEAGVQRMYLQVLDLGDLDHIAMAGADLVPAVADL